MEAGAVDVDQRDLRAAVDAIGLSEEEIVEAVEEGAEMSDAEDDLIALHPPPRPEHAAFLLVKKRRGHVGRRIDDGQRVAAGRRGHVVGSRVTLAGR